MNRKSFHLLVLFAFLWLPVACGGGSDNLRRTDTPYPASFGRDEFRPNYGGDLAGVHYFAEPVITYRIVTAGATDIRLRPIVAVEPGTVQAGDIRGAFRKLEATLAANEPASRRVFVEVPGDDARANIDVVVQEPGDFADADGDTASSTTLGATNTFIPNGATGALGRSVVRLRADLPERVFRSTALHESLHAVGLNGHSRRVGVILRPAQSPLLGVLDSDNRFLIELSRYDVNTLRACYTR